MKTTVKQIPLHSLVILVGSAKSGKSHFAANNFPEYEIVGADNIRYELSGRNDRHDINKEIFEEIKHRAKTKLSIGERAVVDASNLKRWERTKIAHLGVEADVPVFYIIIERPLQEKLKHSKKEDRWFVEKQHELFTKFENDIKRGDGVAEVIDTRIDSVNAIQKFGTGDLFQEIKDRGFKGITVIPDVHGTLESLRNAIKWAQSSGKFIIFLGDVIDYGPKPLECITACYNLVVRGEALMILGNHEVKINKWLNESERGNVRVMINEGNQVTIDIINKLDRVAKAKWVKKFRGLQSLSRFHIRVSNIMFAHAAIDKDFWNLDVEQLYGEYRFRALYGQLDSNEPYLEDGYPNRVYTWVDEIPKDHIAMVGHEIKQSHKPLKETNTSGGSAIFMDTGSGKGGTLSTADIRFMKDNKLKIMHFNQY